VPDPLPDAGVHSLQAADEHPYHWACSPGEVAVYSTPSPAKDTPNEDAALVMPLGEGVLLLAVADGCGGMPAGDRASALAIETLAATVSAAGPDYDLAGAVLAGFDAANRAVLALRLGAGSTLAAVLMAHGAARAFHAGDSMILITGQRGRVRLNAIPHSLTGYALEAGMLSEREALTHDERSTILNLVGSEQMRVEISPAVPLCPRDTVLLASDGLSDNLLTDEISVLARTGPLAGAVARLALASTSRMHEPQHGLGHADDLTIVAYRPHPVGGREHTAAGSPQRNKPGPLGPGLRSLQRSP